MFCSTCYNAPTPSFALSKASLLRHQSARAIIAATPAEVHDGLIGNHLNISIYRQVQHSHTPLRNHMWVLKVVVLHKYAKDPSHKHVQLQ